MASIRKKMTLSFFVVILIPLIVVTLFSAYFLVGEVEKEALNNIRQDIKVASLIYFNKINYLKSFAQLTATDQSLIVALQHNMPEKLSEHLFLFMEKGDITQITVTDAGGRVFVDVPGLEKRGTDLKNDPFVRMALIGNHSAASERIMTSVAGDTKGLLSLTAVYPIFDREGFTQIGVLRVRYHVSKSRKMLNKISGAIMGRVEIFLGTHLVASSSVNEGKSLLGEKGLPKKVIEKTLVENKNYEEVLISKEGYLAEFKPILDLNYRPIGVMAIHTPAEQYYQLRIKSAQSLLLIAIGVLCFGFMIGYWLQMGITRPIIQLTEQTAAVARGDFSKEPVEIKSSDEIGVLSASFNKMKQDLLLYIENLKKTTAERERMAKELEIGHQIQQNFLPSTFPQLDEASIFGQSIPAWEVGGDFFDVFMLDQKRVGLVIADVSGKGVPAALFMALCRSVLRTTALGGHGPDKTLEYVNRFISKDNEACMFVTTFYGILDIQSRELHYANGGHNSPIVFRNSSGEIESLAGTKGTALGIIEDLHYLSARKSLKYGDILLLYTDGIVEAPNIDYEAFGMERLGKILMRNHELTPEQLGAMITGEVDDFSRGLPQSDDVTFLVVKFS